MSAPIRRAAGHTPRRRPAKKERLGRSSGRLRWMWVAVLIGCSGLVYRAVSLQIAPPPILRAATAEAQDQRLSEETLTAVRGSMFDRNGTELAISVRQTTVVANTLNLVDPAAVAVVLAPILNKDPEALTKLLSTKRAFVYLARQVDDTVAAAVLKAKTANNYAFLSLLDESKRFSPSGSDLALSVIGRTDIDGNGTAGLELQYDAQLRGLNGKAVLERGTSNRTIPGGRQEVVAATPGTSLVLSLDRALQYEVEKVLRRVVDEQRAKGATVVLSNPKTGDVYAAANIVRDDQMMARVAPDNRAVTWTFEPGSINKTLTMAGVLDAGLVGADDERVISAKIASYEMEFTDEGRNADQVMTPRSILSMSSNNGTVTWAQDLGKHKLWTAFDRFGLGKITSLNFPGEASGNLLAERQWDDVSFRTMSYGLGLSVTPMQMLNAYNVIANDGLGVPARFVLGEQSQSGVFTPAEHATGRRVVSETTATSMRSMLATVVAEGTGKKAQVAGFSVAGKTGTAWKAVEGGGYGYPGLRHLVVSFVGFLPADDPQLSMIVVIDEPADQYASGGRTAAPVFAEVASFAVRQLRIAPDADTSAPVSRERVRALPEGVAITQTVVYGPPAPTTTTTTTTPKATTTTKPPTTTTKVPTTTAGPKPSTTLAKPTTTGAG